MPNLSSSTFAKASYVDGDLIIKGPKKPLVDGVQILKNLKQRQTLMEVARIMEKNRQIK